MIYRKNISPQPSLRTYRREFCIMGYEAIKSIFEPQSIAIIGASRDQKKVSNIILNNLLKADFKGKIFPINPKVKNILGLKTYPSLQDVPDQIELAVIVVPSIIVPKILRECHRKEIKSVIVISGGFRETGKDGEELEKKVIQIVRKTGIRLVGPNCIGIQNPRIGISMWGVIKKGGPIGIIAQSGTVKGAIEFWAEKEGIGISKSIALGNKVDIDEIDLLPYFAEDPNTKVIAMYLEGITDGRKFLEVASEVTKKKPIVVLKGGKTEAGKRAALSHTKSMAGKDEIFEAAFRQSGIIRAHTIEELYDFSKALAFLPLPKGRRVLIITSSGGAGILAADLCEKLGLKIPQLLERTEKRLRRLLPAYCIFDNPFDLTITTAERFQLVIEENLNNKDNFNAFIPIFGDPIPQAAEAVKSVLKITEKPVLVCYIAGGEVEEEEKTKMHKMGIPVYPSPERAVTALNTLVKRYEMLSRNCSS